MMMMMMMILVVFYERVRVRADTPVESSHRSKLRLRTVKTSKLRLGSWAGARGFRAADPEPLGPPTGGASPPRRDLTAMPPVRHPLGHGPWVGVWGLRADNPNPLVLPHGSDRLVQLLHQRNTVARRLLMVHTMPSRPKAALVRAYDLPGAQNNLGFSPPPGAATSEGETST